MNTFLRLNENEKQKLIQIQCNLSRGDICFVKIIQNFLQ